MEMEPPPVMETGSEAWVVRGGTRGFPPKGGEPLFVPLTVPVATCGTIG